METPSKTRGGQLQVPTGDVLKGPAARSSPDVEEDLGLEILMGDGAVVAALR